MTVDSWRMVDYGSIEIDRVRPLGSKVYIRWEVRNKFLLGGKLVMPDPHRGTQFTGIVEKIGELVPEEYGMMVGDRVIFKQFSGFEKRYDEKKGRIAIVDFDSVVMAIPKRKSIDYGEEDFDFNK